MTFEEACALVRDSKASVYERQGWQVTWVWLELHARIPVSTKSLPFKDEHERCGSKDQISRQKDHKAL